MSFRSLAADANAFLHQLLDSNIWLGRSGFADVGCIDLKDPQLNNVLRIQIGQPFGLQFRQKLRCYLKNAELNEVLKAVGAKAHLTRFPNELGVDLKNTGLDEVFHSKIRKTGRLHFSHELAVDLEDRCLYEVVKAQVRKVGRTQVIGKGVRHIERGGNKKTLFQRSVPTF